MNVHFISIGGSVMHSLAIALHRMGFEVSGSDDEIFEPSKSRLQRAGLFPDSLGWHTEKIKPDLDAVILGMHARPDNPELIRAQELGIRIFSYPEYIYEQSREKIRVVIGGSHGKTTVTSMIMHILKATGLAFDYLVGARVEGFDQMLKLTKAPLIVIEGDEYLSSPIDNRPKFVHYKANIALINGIAWDHINVFPTKAHYLRQFRIFIDSIDANGTLIYNRSDKKVVSIVQASGFTGRAVPISTHAYSVSHGKTFLLSGNTPIPVSVFGKHNVQNISAAKAVCHILGINDEDFYKHIPTFKGANRRLELIAENDDTAVYYDFAHSPSKLKATVEAIKSRFPDRMLVACMELHTYSSLRKDFLSEYQGALNLADKALIYYNQHASALKKLQPISRSDIQRGFDRKDLSVYVDTGLLLHALLNIQWEHAVLVLMSSGNFGGMDIRKLGNKITNQGLL